MNCDAPLFFRDKLANQLIIALKNIHTTLSMMSWLATLVDLRTSVNYCILIVGAMLFDSEVEIDPFRQDGRSFRTELLPHEKTSP